MHYLGIGLIILSMLMFSATYAFFKACGPFLSNTLCIFFVSLFGWLMVLPFVFKEGKKILVTNRFPFIALRTIFGLIAFLCITYALRTVSLAEVVLLNNTAPLFVPLIVWICLKTRISFQVWLGLSMGFVGIFLVFRPGFGAIEVGLFVALLSGLFSAALFVATRQIAHEPFFRVLFYYFLIFIVLLSPFLFIDWTAPPYWVWIFLILAAIFFLAAQLTLTAAMRHAPSHELAPFIYTSVVFAGLIDWVFWRDVPSLLSLIGMVIVCIGGLVAMIKRKA